MANNREKAIEVARSAFIFGRVADSFLVLSILLIFSFFGTLDYEQVFRKSVLMISAPGFATMLGLLLTLSVASKAANIPFHVWVHDITSAPIPVAALILGLCLPVTTIYWVARCYALFLQAPLAMSILSGVGLFTAFFAAFPNKAPAKRCISGRPTVVLSQRLAWI